MEHISKTLPPIMQRVFDDFIKTQQMEAPEVSRCDGEPAEVNGEHFTLECHEGMVASYEVPASWGSGGGSPAYTVERECRTCGGTGGVVD